MIVYLKGGPRSGEAIAVPSPPKAFEFPITCGKDGAMSETLRYERVKKTNDFEYVGKRATKVTGATYKPVGIIAKLRKLVKGNEKK